ncbi:FadR/GntR family transcriptional regulator [Paeniglutamicibacter kerguelensis]|uniref:DNA-binding FadR family transcriptional regulator n=1 Tax=Paeniglutamicibacter kerguelensis TaxID=254788 RepID=A0ABS4XIU6_9MICC|nr:FadR/GntR family transcriptional regulator [Paeniglutamicibacter kerguelensis]MBP2388386.1 DNA-binding FadR family transcriptional regulator [Paeniglutamicibacter kerguelensis]
MFPNPRPKRNRLSEQVADRITADVIRRGLKPGDRLETEPELVEQYDVSRSVIREAGRILDERGLVDIRPGRGMVVAAFDGSGISRQYELMLELTDGTFRQLMEMRLVLEVGMTELAANNHTDEDEARIRETLSGYNSAGADQQMALEWDLAFHRAIAVASSNPFFVHSIEPINGYLRKTYKSSLGYVAEQDATMKEHTAIAEAIFARDGNKAATMARAHLERVLAASEHLTTTKKENS